MSGRHYKWIPAPKTRQVPVNSEKRKRLMKLLKSAEENHAKAGKNIKLLKRSLKKKGYL